GDHLQQRALAGAGVAGQHHQFAVADGEADAAQADVVARIAFDDLIEDDHAPGPRAISASTNSPTRKGCRSSMPSPTPMKRKGLGCWRAIAATTPPLAVPSSLVSTSPVTPMAASKALTCA